MCQVGFSDISGAHYLEIAVGTASVLQNYVSPFYNSLFALRS